MGFVQAIAWLGLFVGCGRIDFGGVAGGTDAGGADAGTDAEAAATACPPAFGPADTFDGGLAAYDVNQDTGAAVADEGGVLQLSLAAESGAGAGVATMFGSAFRETAASIEVIGVPAAVEGTQLAVELEETTHKLGLVFDSGSLGVMLDAGAMTMAPYDATADHWWRIREHAGVAYLEVRPSSGAWTTAYQTAAPAWFDAGDVELSLAVWTWQAVAGPGSAVLDNLNLAPCP